MIEYSNNVIIVITNKIKLIEIFLVFSFRLIHFNYFLVYKFVENNNFVFLEIQN